MGRQGRELAGRHVVVTRAPHQAAELRDLLLARGAIVHEVPTIEVALVSGAELAAVDEAIQWLWNGRFDAMLFTSANTVELVAERLRVLSIPVSNLSHAGVFAVGPATARAAHQHGF